MLKYTLGALAALAIAALSAFIILVQVSDGGADIGPAPVVIITIEKDGTVPLPNFTAPRGLIVELQLNNRSAAPRSIRFVSDQVEQLPQLTGDHGPLSRDSRPGIEITSGPGSIGSALIIFKDRGTYDLSVGYPGVLFPPVLVTIVVE